MKRIICGIGPDGVGTVLHEGPPRNLVRPAQEPGFVPHELLLTWASKELGHQTVDLVDALPGLDLGLRPGEVRFVRMHLPPHDAGSMHRTPHTVDYIAVLSGTATLVMEDGSSAVFEAGDMIVQLGGFHSWRNHTDEPCYVAALMLGVEADPPDAPARVVASGSSR
jgi:mannose-6-phosphate isomerase-like protein (cupin superfamily)